MARSRHWGMPAALVAAVCFGAVSLVTTAPAGAQGAPPGVNVCVFYGICVGPALPGR
ncbi:MAG: hypothetical protein ACRDZ3_02440 [Acidimicrobiia bacterium]